jgi:hypothetical protein
MRVKLAWLVRVGGARPPPFTTFTPSPVKLQCTLQLSGQIHWPCFISTTILLCGVTHTERWRKCRICCSPLVLFRNTQRQNARGLNLDRRLAQRNFRRRVGWGAWLVLWCKLGRAVTTACPNSCELFSVPAACNLMVVLKKPSILKSHMAYRDNTVRYLSLRALCVIFVGGAISWVSNYILHSCRWHF